MSRARRSGPTDDVVLYAAAFYVAVDAATVAELKRTSWRARSDRLADCACCGRPFWVHAAGGSPARYCGRPCRQRAYWRRSHRAAA